MSYEVRFNERGHCWFAYRGLKRYCRGVGKTPDSVKINGSAITIDESLVDAFNRIPERHRKLNIRYHMRKIG